jgi:hypothetical protein
MRMQEIEIQGYARQLLEAARRPSPRPRKRLLPSKSKATASRPKPGGISKPP